MVRSPIQWSDRLYPCFARKCAGKASVLLVLISAEMVLDENFERINQFSDAFKLFHGACKISGFAPMLVVTKPDKCSGRVDEAKVNAAKLFGALGSSVRAVQS
jgi:hypothetical protein